MLTNIKELHSQYKKNNILFPNWNISLSNDPWCPIFLGITISKIIVKAAHNDAKIIKKINLL